MNKEVVKISIPAKSKYLTVIRLTSSAIASNLDFSIEKIEDLKLCISEVCNIGIKSENNEEFTIEYHLSEKDIEVKFLNFNVDVDKVENVEMSKMILQALVEDIEISENSIKMKLFV